MRVTDVVNQLRVLLPKYTDLFSSSEVALSSVSTSGSTATVTTTTPHGLTAGASTTLSRVLFQNTIASVAQDGLVFTFETAEDHDLTQGWQGSVELSGFTDPLWNSSFTLISVPNRRSFKVQTSAAAPTLTGSEVLEELRDDGVNGRHQVDTVPTTTTFTLEGEFLTGMYLSGTLHTGVRVADAVDFERAQEMYTSQNTTDLWAFVVMHDVVTSKSREAYSDATSTLPTGNDVRTRQLDGFSIYLFVNTTQQLSAGQAVDLCRHTLMGPIYQSVFGAKFDSGLTGEDFKAVPTASGIASYVRSVYVHRYDFEVPFEVTSSDAVEPGDTKAFRSIDFDEKVNENSLTVSVDLDDVPLS